MNEHFRLCCACEGEDCEATFWCPVCEERRRVCTHLPGGYDALDMLVKVAGAECMMCVEKRTMSEAWVDVWHKKKGA